MSALTSALAGTYTADQILKFIERVYPDLGSKIRTARGFGRTAEDILRYINKMQKSGFSSPKKTKESNPYLQAKELTEKVHPIGKILMNAAAAGVGAYGLARGLPAIAQSKVGQGILSAVGLSPSAQQPKSTTSAQSMQVSMPSNTPMQQQQAQPSSLQALPGQIQPQSQQPPIDSPSILKQMNVEAKINNLLSAGNEPEIVGNLIDQQLKPGEKKWLDSQIKEGKAKPMVEMVKEYATLQPKAKEVAKPAKGDIVSTPDGLIGDIADVQKTEALVKDDGGKLHKVKISDIEKPPEDLIEAAQNLLQIPEVDRSAVISLVTYRPRTKEMFVQYHNGETYSYDDVPEDQVHEIANAMGIPVTSGKNVYGAWEQGKQDSRGAALIHGIIRDPKYSKENEGKTWEKLGTYYDYWKKLRKRPKKKKQ